MPRRGSRGRGKRRRRHTSPVAAEVLGQDQHQIGQAPESKTEEWIIMRKKRKRGPGDLPEPPIFIHPRPGIIGPRDIVVNFSLNKVKLETDYIPIVKQESMDDNQNIFDSGTFTMDHEELQIEVNEDEIGLTTTSEPVVEGDIEEKPDSQDDADEACRATNKSPIFRKSLTDSPKNGFGELCDKNGCCEGEPETVQYKGKQDALPSSEEYKMAVPDPGVPVLSVLEESRPESDPKEDSTTHLADPDEEKSKILGVSPAKILGIGFQESDGGQIMNVARVAYKEGYILLDKTMHMEQLWKVLLQESSRGAISLIIHEVGNQRMVYFEPLRNDGSKAPSGLKGVTRHPICLWCAILFKSNRTLKKHGTEKHKGGEIRLFYCKNEKCNRNFTRDQDLKLHIKRNVCGNIMSNDEPSGGGEPVCKKLKTGRKRDIGLDQNMSSMEQKKELLVKHMRLINNAVLTCGNDHDRVEAVIQTTMASVRAEIKTG